MIPQSPETAPPIAIGGIGGSGTRLVAEMLRALGVHLGDDLNLASDSLWFTFLFKRLEILDCDETQFDRLVHILVSALRGDSPLDPVATSLVRDLAGTSRPRHSTDWLGDRRESLLTSTGQPRTAQRWGWKEPNTHVVIKRLWLRMPTLRYIHVIRHGVDMAFSSNQNQLRLWGPRVLGEDGPITPQRSLAYWCRVHRHLQALNADNPERMYWLDYDALCQEPQAEANKLCRFLDCDPGALAPLLGNVRKPAQPRHAGHSLDGFARDDLAFVRSLGYAIAPVAAPTRPCTTLGLQKKG